MTTPKLKEFFQPGLLIVLGMGAFAVFMGGYGGYDMFLKTYLQARESYSWQPVQATVIYSRTAHYTSLQHNQTRYYLDLGYQYQWQDKSYTGRRYCFGKAPTGFEMHRLIRKMKQGTQITCFVDPDNPAESVVSRTTKLSAVGIGLCMTFVLTGLAIIFFAMRSFLRGTWKCEIEDTDETL